MTGYNYTEDTQVVLNGKQFETILVALGHGIEATVTKTFPHKFMYVNAEGKEVKKPTMEQLASGAVQKQLDFEGTFSEPTLEFNDKITSPMLDANIIANQIHNQMVQEGKVELIQENVEGGAE